MFKVEVSEKYRNMNILVILQDGGWRCGYVRLDDPMPYDVHCHGGITFEEYSEQGDYFPVAGYWIGFDCIHSGDGYDIDAVKKAFGIELKLSSWMEKNVHVWGTNEVADECRRIVDQLLDDQQPEETDRVMFESSYDRLMRICDQISYEDALEAESALESLRRADIPAGEKKMKRVKGGIYAYR